MLPHIMWPESIKIQLRLKGELIETKFNALTARVGGTCNMSAPMPEMQTFKLLEEEQLQNLPQHPNRMQNLCQCQCQPPTSESYHWSPISEVRYHGRFNWGVSEVDIFVGDILVTALIDS